MSMVRILSGLRSGLFLKQSTSRLLTTTSQASGRYPLSITTLGDGRKGLLNTKRCDCLNCRSMSGGVPAGLHTKVDKELSTFLTNEIDAEKIQVKNAARGPPGVPGYEVKADGANITLSRKLNDETITVKFNVNATVDTDDSEDEFDSGSAAQQEPQAVPDMKSKPDFVVEISKPNGRILAFNCRIYPDEPEADNATQQQEGDKFEIESFTVLNADDIDEYGDWNDNLYVGDCGIIDGQMYDLLMGLLDARGVGNEFVDHLIAFSTQYEHSKYVGLLENLKSFVDGK